METGIIGIVAAAFLALTARRLGHDWGKGAGDLGLAALAFVLSIVTPSFAVIDGEPGFVVAGAVFAAIGAYLLFRAATKTAGS